MHSIENIKMIKKIVALFPIKTLHAVLLQSFFKNAFQILTQFGFHAYHPWAH